MTDLVIRVRADGTAEVVRGLRNVDQAADRMGQRAGTASQQMGKLGTTAGTARNSIGQLSGTAGTASGQVAQLGTRAGSTRGAVTGLAGATGTARNSLGQLQASTHTASQGLLAMTARTTGLVAGLTGIGLGIRSAVTSFVDYDSTMRRVGAITSATESQMAAMRDMAQELGSTTKFSTGEAAAGFQSLAMAGLDADKSMAALPGVLQLAAAGALDLGTAADIATNVLSGYSLEIDQLGRVNDVLAKAFTSSNTNLQQLGTAFTTAGSVASAAGQEFEVTAAVLGLMANAGFAGERSGTALRGALARLLNPTAEVTDTLERLGVEINDSAGNMRSLDDIMIDLSKTGLSAGDAIKIFSQEAGPAMLAAIRQGEGGIVSMVDKMRNAEGTAERVAGALEGSLGGALIKTASAAGAAGLALVGISEPALIAFFEEAASAISLTAGFLREFEAEARVAATVIGSLLVARTLGPIIASLGTAALAAAGGFNAAAVAAGLLRGALALLGGPAGLVITLGIGMVALARASDDDADAATLAAESNRELAQVLNQQAPITDNASAAIIANARANLEGARAALALAESLAAAAANMNPADLARFGSAATTAAGKIDGLRAEVGSLETQLNRATGRLEEQRGALRNGSQLMDLLGESTRETADRTRDGTEAVNEAIEAAKGMRAATVEATEALVEAGDQYIANDAHVQAYRESLEATGPAAEQAAAAQKQAAEESERAWKQLGDSIQSNLSTAFVNLVDNGLSSFRDLFDTVKRWFIKFLADLAAAALARPIMLAIGATGLGGMINPAMAGMPGGNMLGIGGTVIDLLGLGGGATGLAGLVGGSASTAAGIGGNLGALGSTSFGVAGAGAGGWASTVAAALPWVAAAGAVLALVGGGLFESTPPRAFVVGDAATGDLLQQVEKKGQDAAGLIKMLDQIVASTSDYLADIGGQLDAGAAQFDIHINPDRLRLTFVPGSGWEDRLALDVDPEDSAAVADAVAKMMLAAVTEADLSAAAEPVAAFFESLGLDMIEALPQGAAEQILGQFQNIGEAATAAAEQFPWLAQAIRDTAASSDIGAQQLAAYTVALVAVGDALSTSPAEAYEQALRQNNTTLLENLAEQGAGVQQLALQYDGSAESAQALAQGVLSLKANAVQALAAIDAAQQQVTQSVGNMRQTIELSLMDQGQKVDYWIGEAERIQDELANATDPAEIARLTQELTGAVGNAWSAMDTERRQAEKEWALGLLTTTEETAGKALTDAAKTVDQIWVDAANTVEVELSAAAGALHAGAEAIRQAGQQLSAAIPSSINVNVTSTVTVNAADQPGGGRALGGIVRAASGWIGSPGAAGADTIPILVGEGEAVLNRHQQQPVNTALQALYGYGLDGLFARETRPHTAAFAAGGMPDTAGFAARSDWLRAWADSSGVAETVRTATAAAKAFAREAGETYAEYLARYSRMLFGRAYGTDHPGDPRVLGFADGGSHPGGWRLVGERGPELEFTPPSQIVNAGESRGLLDNRDLLAELKALREELRSGQYAIAKHTAKTAKYLERWDGDRLPEERTI